MAKKKKSRARGAGRVGLYITEAFLLTVVVAGAILTPQILFRVKDELLDRRTELGRMESADMEFLGGSYEESMHLRMLGFAKGLAAGDRFYIAARNLEQTQELTEYLRSEKGLYQEYMFVLVGLELLHMVFWEQDYTVSQWKQYVVYSDNYAEGISFLLWYIELQCEDSMVIKLLVDGETGSVYGVKTEGRQSLTTQDSDMGGYRNAVYEELFYNDSICREFLFYLMICYEAQAWKELYNRLVWQDGGYDNGSAAYLDEQEIRELLGNAEYTRGDDSLSFQLPYEDAFLEFRIEIGAVNVSTGYGHVIMYPDVTAGIRQLYELIPEFAQTGASDVL